MKIARLKDIGGPPAGVSYVVAIPARNERERIVDCLEALAAQVDAPTGGLGILLFLNNCTDDTREVVDAWTLRSPWPIRVVARDDPSASAGWARRQAMEASADWLEETGVLGGVLLTTDADSRVAPNWIACNRAALTSGADAVAGRVVFDPAEVAMLPLELLRRQALEAAYELQLAELEARLAPRKGNPWPCHRMKSGASIAVTLQAYRRVGGIPPLSSGEDHAFIDQLGTMGFVVRHADNVVVTTSGRLDGRARGGTADTLRNWCEDPEIPCEAKLQRLSVFVWRALRGEVNPSQSAHGWRRPLRPRDLPRQIGLARKLLSLLRWLERRPGGKLRAASLPSELPKRLSMP